MGNQTITTKNVASKIKNVGVHKILKRDNTSFMQAHITINRINLRIVDQPLIVHKPNYYFLIYENIFLHPLSIEFLNMEI